jgi:hypothetical protein
VYTQALICQLLTIRINQAAAISCTRNARSRQTHVLARTDVAVVAQSRDR